MLDFVNNVLFSDIKDKKGDIYIYALPVYFTNA
jgi:hypothetical protein